MVTRDDGTTETDQHALLDLIGDVQGTLDIGEFRACLLAALQRVVPADWVSLNDIGPDPLSTVVLIEPPFPPEAHELFARLAHENPLLIRYQRTRDGRAYRFSDVVSVQELHRLALYREFYAPIGLEHQVAFTLPHEPDRLLAVALSRRERDFSDAERALLDQARPFLIQAYRAAVEHSRLRDEVRPSRDRESLAAVLVGRGLTRREAEVLSWVAMGHSSLAVGDRLGLSERTVQKHLERCYGKLAVHNRSDAARVAWSLVEPGDG